MGADILSGSRAPRVTNILWSKGHTGPYRRKSDFPGAREAHRRAVKGRADQHTEEPVNSLVNESQPLHLTHRLANARSHRPPRRGWSVRLRPDATNLRGGDTAGHAQMGRGHAAGAAPLPFPVCLLRISDKEGCRSPR